MKVSIGGQSNTLKIQTVDSGKLLLMPQPVELSGNLEAIVSLYRLAMRQASVQVPFTVDDIDDRIMIRTQTFKQSILYSIVSDLDEDIEFDLMDEVAFRTLHISIPAHRAVMFVLSRADGRVLTEYGGAVERDEPPMRGE